ncbi:hypothetical protein PPERSA_04673 [Pseudocohnilembus persalinus]|uniref:Uncharacterized protein n=1 Tax=Pseudocohnilembus persalinus TaxID=266149 RepID=A0A0V0R4G3_PSEPJ|nr:hypothetical protein PPERSA_04673 [Pseudocohnilembus persalinus]|eukprot:KRX09367.1 hypothetical protein PPERSA_04673 [Pseudocohnilembus persalinus]
MTSFAQYSGHEEKKEQLQIKENNMECINEENNILQVYRLYDQKFQEHINSKDIEIDNFYLIISKQNLQKDDQEEDLLIKEIPENREQPSKLQKLNVIQNNEKNLIQQSEISQVHSSQEKDIQQLLEEYINNLNEEKQLFQMFKAQQQTLHQQNNIILNKIQQKK